MLEGVLSRLRRHHITKDSKYGISKEDGEEEWFYWVLSIQSSYISFAASAILMIVPESNQLWYNKMSCR